MSSAICQDFIQNAWKKELCSNCFKSKDEHKTTTPKLREIHTIPIEKLTGIIKKPNKIKKPNGNVTFHQQLSEFIGYGGEEWSSDEEPCEKLDGDTNVDTSDDDDDLKRLTKQNTNFNTNSLNDTIETKKNYTPLLLGKPLVDANGNKQTLMVTVTPFGQSQSTNGRATPTTCTDNVVMTSSHTKTPEEKSLLDEINETLEKSKKFEKKIISLTRTPALKRDKEKPIVFQTSTAKIELVQPEMNNNNPETDFRFEKNVEKHPDIRYEKYHEKPDIRVVKNLEKNPDIRFEKINEKPDILFEKNHEKPDIRLVKNQESHPDNRLDKNNAKTDFRFVKNQETHPDIRFEKINEKPDIRFEKNHEKPDIRLANNKETHPDNRIEKNTEKTDFRFVKNHPDIRSDKNHEKPDIRLDRKFEIELEKRDVQSDENFRFVSTTSDVTSDKPDENFRLTQIEDPVVKPDVRFEQTVKKSVKPEVRSEGKFRFTQSREQAGKPDGREDPEVNDELPALPLTPPPVLETFLPEKPKIPVKPTVMVAKKTLNLNTKHDSNKRRAPEPPEEAISLQARKSISLSTDNLQIMDERRKDKSKGRFSLKKFLRMGSNKDLTRFEPEETPEVRPRITIVHPSELNGAKVEVLTKPTASKPPPPPRNIETSLKPTAHPPKSSEVLRKQRQMAQRRDSTKTPETVYANIGEVRSAIVPNKPMRTASMREREKRAVGENVYDYVGGGRSSSPESDSGAKGRGKGGGGLGKRCESSIDVSGEYLRCGRSMPRSVSLTYCGSETESEIYSPYSFYGSESEVTEDDHDWIQNGRTHKLRSRKGRSIVHKNLEDNYGAVVVANHEALAQVLENIQQTVHIQPALRGLKTATNLHLTDFTIKNNGSRVVVGRRVFYQALWGVQHVTLSLNVASATCSALSFSPFQLNSLTEFSDLVPKEYLPGRHEDDDDASTHVQATVVVLPWLQVDSLQSYVDTVKNKNLNQEEMRKEASFVLLQLVNALKMLQAQGIEEVPLSMENFVLCKEMDRDAHHRLCVLQSVPSDVTTIEKYVTLCSCASKAANLLQPTSKTTSLLHSILNNERAVSLTQVKSILEFQLWGPSDVTLATSVRDREMALQRWLDLQRATVLHGLVCTRVQLTVYEECHLLFLVRTNARMMCDASLLIESNSVRHANSSKA